MKATGSRSLYQAKSYRLKIRVSLKSNENLSATGYLIVHIDTQSESLFESQIFEIKVDENLKPPTEIFGKISFYSFFEHNFVSLGIDLFFRHKTSNGFGSSKCYI